MLGQSAEDHGEAVREVLVHLLLLKAMSYQGLQAGGDGLQGVGNLLICIGSGLVLDMGLEGGELLLQLVQGVHVGNEVMQELLHIEVGILDLLGQAMGGEDGFRLFTHGE